MAQVRPPQNHHTGVDSHAQWPMTVHLLELPLQCVECVSACPAGSLVEHVGRLLVCWIYVSRYIGMNVIKSYLWTEDLGFTESVQSKVDTLLLKLVVWYAGRS